ncbi:MAG TPA: PEPxxWA-CTERM sorting domain-containing protein [Sphingobium sp.]|nr:PEPxxWA-CTERM sorting domain-containing protein [Sphingobium sp.]
MRFVRLLAASAALACSGLTGQAQAATIFETMPHASLIFSVPKWVPALGKVTFDHAKCRTDDPLDIFYYDRCTVALDKNGAGADLVSFTRFGNTVFFAMPDGTLDLTSGQVTGTSTSTWSSATGPVTLLIHSSQVPEPATWAMMIFGMGAIGAAIRVRLARSRLASLPRQ